MESALGTKSMLERRVGGHETWSGSSHVVVVPRRHHRRCARAHRDDDEDAADQALALIANLDYRRHLHGARDRDPDRVLIGRLGTEHALPVLGVPARRENPVGPFLERGMGEARVRKGTAEPWVS